MKSVHPELVEGCWLRQAQPERVLRLHRAGSIVLDHNLQNSKLVKLHIHIPPADISSPHHVLEVSGKVTSAVFDSAEEAFRSSISFIQFTLDSDQTYLQSLLS